MPSPSEKIIVDEAAVQADGTKIRLLDAADVPEAMSLKQQAGWNQTARDWLRLLELEPGGCFAAVAGEKLVGTITTTIYGQKLAWIGMVLVNSEYRRRKIATRLMTAALAYIDELNIETVKLDATKEGCCVYENFGFETESMIERWCGIASGKSKFECSSVSISDLPKIYETDRLRFGADRSKLFGKLLEDSYRPPLLKVAEDGIPAGYALIRRGAKAAYLGPVVAEDERIAKLLLDESLAQVAGETIYIDVNTNFKGFEKILAERGFARQRKLVRMSRGEKNIADRTDQIFAIAGPEVG